MYHYEKVLKASDIVWFVSTSAVIWSSELISVTCVELLWAVYKFLRMNNIDLKCSFVQCPKYHMSWWNGAAELLISINLLCGKTAAELHNSVDLLCGTTVAETFERWTLWKIQQTQIDSRPSANSWNIRRFSKRLKDERFTKKEKQTSAKVWKMNAEDTRITMWVSASKWGKHKQGPQSEANLFRHNAISKNLAY